MAWEAAGFAAAFAFLAAAGFIAFAAYRLGRLLKQWEQTAIRLAKKADDALDEYIQLARQSRQAAAAAGRTAEGFARLAEGAGSVGDAAQFAAQAAAETVSAWRDRLVRVLDAERETSGGQPQALAEWFGQLLGKCLQGRCIRPPGPGTNADQGTGE